MFILRFFIKYGEVDDRFSSSSRSVRARKDVKELYAELLRMWWIIVGVCFAAGLAVETICRQIADAMHMKN